MITTCSLTSTTADRITFHSLSQIFQHSKSKQSEVANNKLQNRSHSRFDCLHISSFIASFLTLDTISQRLSLIFLQVSQQYARAWSHIDHDFRMRITEVTNTPLRPLRRSSSIAGAPTTATTITTTQCGAGDIMLLH